MSAKAMKALENGLLFEQNPMLYALAKSLCRQITATDDDKALLFYSINLLGARLSAGHVALHLERFEQQSAPFEWQVDWQFPSLAIWVASLQRLLAQLAQLAQLPQKSLILQGNYLLLARFDALENFIVSDLLLRAQVTEKIDWTGFNYKDQKGELDWQQVAVVNSLSERLSFIVGGPGTGKTTTVSKLLTAILKKEGHDKFIIKLAAPTGKAATRMASSLQEKMQTAELSDALKTRLPKTANTLHRLLGWSARKRRFTHDAENPLFVDCLVVDEASMVDVSMFAALLAAVPHTTRLIFLGDPFQLPSVQAGSVLSDICNPEAINQFSQAKVEAIPALCAGDVPLSNNIVQLKKSHRFRDDKGIGALAKACLEADASRLKMALASEDIMRVEKDADGVSLIQALVIAHWNALQKAPSVEAAFGLMGQFQLLCANKEGDFSTGFFNQAMQRFASQSGCVTLALQGDRLLYPGMPIMLETNRYDLGLYNGDMGVVWVTEGHFWLCFMDQNLQVQRFLPQQLTGYSSAHAITVHKSQGSEYDQIAFSSPSVESPMLSNQLLYTAITRAKEKVYLLANVIEIEQALRRLSKRDTLLQEKLLGVTL